MIVFEMLISFVYLFFGNLKNNTLVVVTVKKKTVWLWLVWNHEQNPPNQ